MTIMVAVHFGQILAPDFLPANRVLQKTDIQSDAATPSVDADRSDVLATESREVTRLDALMKGAKRKAGG